MSSSWCHISNTFLKVDKTHNNLINFIDSMVNSYMTIHTHDNTDLKEIGCISKMFHIIYCIIVFVNHYVSAV